MKTNGWFKLKCVSCKMVEERPAEDCREQPFCNKCFSPMFLVSVKVKKSALHREAKP